MKTANNYMNESMLVKTQKIFSRSKRRLFTNAKIPTIRLRAGQNLFNVYLVCLDNRDLFVNNCTSVRTGDERSSFKREKTSRLASKWSSLPTSLKT